MTGNSPSNKEKWKSIWPSRILKLIAVIQIILTVAILALEAGSVGIHPFLATVYAGFYCSLFFTAAWISIFTVTCCNRDSLPCAIFTLVMNVLSIGAAIVVIYYDSQFIQSPSLCLLQITANCVSSYSIGTFINSTSYATKDTLIKVQLGCAAGMLLTNLIYVIIFIVVTIRVCWKPADPDKPVPAPFVTAPFVAPPRSAPTTSATPIPAPIPPQTNPNLPPSSYPLVIPPPQGLHLPTYIAQCPYCYGLMRVG